MNLDFLKNKRVLILGLGKEGESTFKLLRRRFPDKVFGLADQNEFSKLSVKIKQAIVNDKNVNLYLGNGYLATLENYEIIFKTPGISQKILEPFLRNPHAVLSQTKLFLSDQRNNSIGVTGTKGKSTTASLIHHILKHKFKNTKLVGNIGKPVLFYLPKKKKGELFVIELSSHQLYDVQASPHIAVFLNIFPEHLDYYKSFKEYWQAKTNITKWQKAKDFFIYNNDFKELRNLAKKTRAKKISFSLRDESRGVYLKNNWIFYQNQKIMSIKEIPLAGLHNVANVMAAIAVAKIFKIKTEIIVRTIKTFKPLEHRIELFAKTTKTSFYNDSIATVPEATIQALHSIPKIQTLIAGGFDRGQDFKNLAKNIILKRISFLILLPETGGRIAKELEAIKGKKPQIIKAKGIKEAAQIAVKKTIDGACLLSPASASFNMFKDYKDRGRQFKKYVRIFLEKND